MIKIIISLIGKSISMISEICVDVTIYLLGLVSNKNIYKFKYEKLLILKEDDESKRYKIYINLDHNVDTNSVYIVFEKKHLGLTGYPIKMLSSGKYINKFNHKFYVDKDSPVYKLIKNNKTLIIMIGPEKELVHIYFGKNSLWFNLRFTINWLLNNM